jgi:PAS domain S-box-containing protein
MPGRELRALLESEQRLRAIYDGTYEYIGVLAPDGTLLEANRASLEFAAGTTRADVVGKPFWETVWFAHTPGAPEKLRAAIARAAAGETFRVEWPLRRPSGEVVVFDFSLRPIRDEHGAVVLIVPEGRDITDLKRAEQVAQYQEQRYRLLFERTTDGIWLADQQGRFVDANPAACRMLGYSHAEHVALSVDDVVRPTDRPRLQGLMARLAEGVTVTDVWDIRRADGTYLPLELSHAFTPDGLWQANGRDITVRQRVEAEREQRRQDEHEISELLQRSLLPVLAGLDGQDLAVRYEAALDALEVGGDWYDAIALDGGRLAVAVGDVVGKGAAAAAAMGQLRSAARALLLEGHGPARMLTILDDFARRIPDARCSTLFCALIDPASGQVVYSSAGHPPGILDSGERDDPGGQHYELLEDAQSVPLAVLADLERPQATVTLRPGSTLLLYTDGLVERRGLSIDVGIKAAAAVLSDVRTLDLAGCASRLTNELVDPTHDDDVAFLIYRYGASPVGHGATGTVGAGLASAGAAPVAAAPGFAAGVPLSVRFPADPDELRGMRITLRDWFTALGLGALTANELLHAIGEVASNAIEHGSLLDPARSVAITGEQDPGWIRVAVSDDGQWVEPVPDSGRGRGLTLARALVDRLEISATGTGTTVHLTKRTTTP